MTFFSAGSELQGRDITIKSDDSAITFDQDKFGTRNGIKITYTYTAKRDDYCLCNNPSFLWDGVDCRPYFSSYVSASQPWGIWRATDYDAVTSTWIEARRLADRNVNTFGKLDIVQEVGHGSVIPVTSLRGTISSSLVWPFLKSEDFTICSMSRYTGHKNRGRIIAGTTQNGGTCDLIHGHHDGYAGSAFYGTWATAASPANGIATDWLILCGQNGLTTASPNNVIANGTY